MWIYSQTTGDLWCPQGKTICSGYSGYEEGKNNPSKEAVRNVGPIPKGKWFIGEVYNSQRVGPLALPLYPNGHNALGRSDFLVHGDSKSNPGLASKGCLIMPRSVRELMIQECNKDILVIE